MGTFSISGQQKARSVVRALQPDAIGPVPGNGECTRFRLAAHKLRLRPLADPLSFCRLRLIFPGFIVQPTDTANPDYFHRVVDCQWACPAHTDVPEYIRLIALGEFADAYMVNRESNVFPGILGRVCDRPCEPACRRGRVEEKPVAICRLKRVAADHKDPIVHRLPKIPTHKNGKRVVCIGAGPASLTVANDLLPLGYDARRADAHQHPGVPSAGIRARRGDRLHHRDGRRDPLRAARRQPQEAARHRRV
jgi:hypothetical protein